MIRSTAAVRFAARPLALIALTLALAAQAQTSNPSAQEIIDALKPDAAVPARRMRGLSLETDQPAQAARRKPGKAVTEAVQSRFVDLSVNFEFNSAELTAQGRELLTQLSEALASEELSGVSSVRLEGHTDGVGSASYNRALSLRRAQSVREFLQATPELRGKRFQVVGKGASELLDRDNPADGSNRRVRVFVFYAGDAPAANR